MAVETAELAMVHIALDEIISLHPVLMCRQVWILVEVGISGLDLFKPPVVGQTFSGQKSDRPVIGLAGDRVAERPPLTVALHTCIVPAHIIECLRIDNILPRWMLRMRTAWSMTLLAANVPLGHLFRFDVVVDRVASIACRPGGPVEVCRAIEGHPPVGTSFHVIGEPAALFNVPLRRQRKVIVASLGEVTLFPTASVHKRHFVKSKGPNGIFMFKISQHRFWVLLGISDHVRHPCFLPVVVLSSMATLATLRPDKMRLRFLGACPRRKQDRGEHNDRSFRHGTSR